MVKEIKAERHAKEFTSWSQFVVVLFCQLGRVHSLREISRGLRSWIEIDYNRLYIHLALSHISPEEFGELYLRQISLKEAA